MLLTLLALALLTRDVAASLGAKFYLGVLSNIGALLWCAAATTCFAGAAVLRRFPAQRECAVLLNSDILLWLIGCLFATSVLFDTFVSNATAFEDIPKVAGVCTWLCCYWRLRTAWLDAELRARV